MKLIDKIKLNDIIEYRLFNLPIYRYSLINKKIQYIDILPFRSLYRVIEKKYFSNIKDIDFDDIYIVWNNTGETWQFLTIAKEYFKQNSSKKPLLITDKLYHLDLVKMLLTDIQHINISVVDFDTRIFLEKYVKKIKKHRFFLIFPLSFFFKLEERLQEGQQVHFFEEILKQLNLNKQNLIYTKPIISEEARLSAIEKVRDINLDINNFVFISPESKSNPTMSKDFWDKMVLELNRRGYDTYFNIVGSLNTIKADNLKSTYLTIEEACYLASKAKAIIGLRSGFMEIVNSCTDIPIYCFYSHFRKRMTPEMSADKVMTGFSLMKCPPFKTDLIKEYNADIIEENQLLEKLMEDFEKGVER